MKSTVKKQSGIFACRTTLMSSVVPSLLYRLYELRVKPSVTEREAFFINLPKRLKKKLLKQD